MNYLDYVKETNHNILKNGVLRKFPYLGTTIFNTKFVPSEKVQTAATDGVVVYYSENYLENLSYDEKIFLFSHELMHIAFNHLLRRKDKDPKLWNIATDAVINQILKSENLPLPEGGVDIEEALHKSAEDVYNQLKENQDQNSNGQGGGGPSDEQSGDGEYTPGNGGTGEHEIWDEAIKKLEEMESESLDNIGENGGQSGEQLEKTGQQKSSPNSSGGQEESDENDTSKNSNQKSDEDFSSEERNFTERNKEKKEELGESIREKMGSSAGETAGNSQLTLGTVGSGKPVVSWRRILRREFDREEDRWSYRKASEENDFQARIETLEVRDYPMTEVLLDTSGSVDEDLLLKFLRQLKPLLKESKIRVGCFDTKFYGFEEIKRSKDIDKLVIKGRGGTDFDKALRSFSKDKTINKIIFTDGYASVSESEYNLKLKKVYWIVWDSKNFNPCCGKVIFVDKDDIKFKSPEQEDITFDM
ncbi:MAG: hypothetical protein E7345_05395 [Clostridiales bacterium]|nr:hypothetical protein [Clostridiales bacterium]